MRWRRWQRSQWGFELSTSCHASKGWHPDVPTASRRENSLKARERDWKLRLIEATNPDWNDLSPGLFGEGLDAADWLATDFPDNAT